MRLSFLTAALLVTACSANSPANLERSLWDQARFDDKLQCMDDLIDGRNQPITLATRICTARSWQAYPPR